MTLAALQKIQRDHKCAVCGGGLIMPWVPGEKYGEGHSEIRCLKNPSHKGTVLKGRTRKLADGKEYDIMTQQEIVPMPKTEDAMLKRVNEAAALGLFPGKMTEEQSAVLAQVALAYGLDPIMREIIPYQGLPYVTIAGRRRKDSEAGNYGSFHARPLTPEEKEWYLEAEAYEEGDLVGMGVFDYYGKDGRQYQVERFAKVTKKERNEMRTYRDGPRKGQQYAASPVVRDNPIEILHKRMERGCREMAFGPIERPSGLPQAMPVIEEGDEEQYLDAQWRDVDYETGEVTTTSPEEPEAPETDTGGDAEGSAEQASNVSVPEGYRHLVDRAGQHGLDADAFCKEVLAQDSFDAFEKLGGNPAIAEKRLATWEKQA